MNKYRGITAMMVLTGAMLLLTHLPASGDEEVFLRVDETYAKFIVQLNCKISGWAKGYPCSTPDPTWEVQNLLDQVENHLSIDPDCRDIHYGTMIPASQVRPQVWELEVQIAFGDEKQPGWVLIPPGNTERIPRGYNQPPDMVHIVCGIIAHKGAKRIE